MIRMVTVRRQSVTFCKYTVAGLLWLAVITANIVPVYIVLAVLLVSALTGVHRAPLVVLYDLTFAKFTPTSELYVNLHSVRFAHLFGSVICILSLAACYLIGPAAGFVTAAVLAVLQTVAALGYCSAQKIYECVICGSGCCRFGKKIRGMKKNA